MDCWWPDKFINILINFGSTLVVLQAQLLYLLSESIANAIYNCGE
jgi:hypothetical protein